MTSSNPLLASSQIMSNVTDEEHHHDIDDKVTLSLSYVHIVLLPVFSLLTILANLATVYAFIKDRSLREKPSDLLILSLSGSDLMMGLIVLPLASPNMMLNGYWPFGESICRVMNVVSAMSSESSLLILVAISFDRYLLVSIPYPRYVKRQSQHRIYLYIGMSWGIAAVPCVIEGIFWEHAKKIDATAAGIDFNTTCLSPSRRIGELAAVLFLVFVLMPILFVIFLNTVFLYRLRKRLKARNRVNPSNHADEGDMSTDTNSAPINHNLGTGETRISASSSSNRKKSKYMKPAITLAVLVAAMLVCMLPYCLYVMVVEVFCPGCDSDITVVWNLSLLIDLNSLLNPCLYAATQNKIRRFYRARFKIQDS